MIGTNAGPIPMLPAFSNNNAGLQRANERIAATETAHQKTGLSRQRSLRRMEIIGSGSSGQSLGTSLTPIASTATDRKPGIAASQNTSRKLSSLAVMRPIAVSGPATAPIVESA